MTKEAFMNLCQSEFHCTPEAAEHWCRWADDLYECDSIRADPETGKVEEGEDPIITPEEFLDQFWERLEVMAHVYDAETVAKTMQSGCYHYWEMLQAARFIWRGGDPDKAQEISCNSGLFEETEEEDKEYRRLRWEVARKQLHSQAGQEAVPIRLGWILADRAEQEYEGYIQSVIQISAQEICERSLEITTKESLLSSIINEACDLRQEILCRIMEEPAPLDTLYQFLQSEQGGCLLLKEPLRKILERFNDSFPAQMETASPHL